MADITLDELPDPEDRNAVFEFAMSFNGYEHYGSFEECARRASLRERQTLTDLRNELFFAARASNHRGDDDFLDVYRELLPIFEKLVAEKP